MVDKNTPAPMQASNTRISRRTVARGAVWSAPIVAVSTAAPAFAASPCDPVLTLGPRSCKCPGQSQSSQPWVYFLVFCITSDDACGVQTGQEFSVTSVVSNSGVDLLPGAGSNCGYAGLPVNGTVGDGGCTPVVRLESSNSAHFLDITYSVAGGPAQLVRVPAPPDCSSISGLETRCSECVD